MTDTITITSEMTIRCNRCDAKSKWPKSPAEAIRENSACYRIQAMAVADCGHMDAHWFYIADNS
jgi:hypothetical protein